VSCVKSAELIDMQFGMLSWVRPQNIITWVVGASMERGTFGGIGPMEKHCKVM